MVREVKLKKRALSKQRVGKVKLVTVPDSVSVIHTFQLHESEEQIAILNAAWRNHDRIENWYFEVFKPYYKYDAYADEIELDVKTVDFILAKLQKHFNGEDL